MTQISMSMYPHLAREFINIIGAVVDEFRLSISKDGWEIRAVDAANVALIDIDLPVECFRSYEFADSGVWTSSIDGHPTGVMQESLDVGIDVDEIKSFMGGLYDAEPVLQEELQEPVDFTFSKAPARFGNKYQLELRQGIFKRTMILIDVDEVRKAPKAIRFPSDYMMLVDSFYLLRTVKKAQKVSDYIHLGFRYDKSTGDMLFIASTEDDKDMPWEASINVELWQKMRDDPRTEARSIFSSDYLEDILVKAPHGKVWFFLGQDYPCKISFGIGTSGKCEYMQAPRLETE